MEDWTNHRFQGSFRKIKVDNYKNRRILIGIFTISKKIDIQ